MTNAAFQMRQMLHSDAQRAAWSLHPPGSIATLLALQTTHWLQPAVSKHATTPQVEYKACQAVLEQIWLLGGTTCLW
jgi:hypothetical protein